MKLVFKFRIYILFAIFAFGCSNDDNTTNTETEKENVELTSNVEKYEGDLIEDGLVLAIESGQDKSYLIDKTGKKIKEWNFDTYLGNDFEIMPDGKLLGMFRTANPIFSFGGGGGIVKILNSNGTTDWEYEYASADYLAHHDVEMLPNGNVLFLVWEKISVADAQLAGVDTEGDIYPEALIEVDPKTDTIVWEWHSFDHIIQDKFPAITSTYGALNENPNLININYHQIENGDIMHANGIDYDTEKDVIYISVNFYNEVWVIDHSTTTAEAKTGAGGNYNKGGNLLYRFGNPETYDNSVGETLFNRNHFPNLLEGDEPGAGNLLIYVNGKNVEQSTVYEFAMPKNFNLGVNTNNEPEIVWSFTDPELFHDKISGAVRLKNGNTLICEGDYGFWEVTPSKEVVWKYKSDKVSFWRGYGYTFDSPEIKSLNLSK